MFSLNYFAKYPGEIPAFHDMRIISALNRCVMLCLQPFRLEQLFADYHRYKNWMYVLRHQAEEKWIRAEEGQSTIMS